MSAVAPKGMLVAALAAIICLSGCVSPKYQRARENTPPAVPLNVRAQQPPLEATLLTVIVYGGPGSWKRRAFWDEYVVALHNMSALPLTVAGATLVDFAGTPHNFGTNPWRLERQSKTLEQKYHDTGIAFVRNTAPVVVIGSTGGGLAAALGADFMTSTGSSIAVATVVAIPVYYASVLTINHYNKRDIHAEFARRRLEFPVLLAPGETRYGSLFFPMVPQPRQLAFLPSQRDRMGELVVPLQALEGLHIRPAAQKASQAEYHMAPRSAAPAHGSR